MSEIVSTPEPLLVTETGCAALVAPTASVPKDKLEADKMTDEVLPVRLRIWGLPGALSEIVIDAFRIPCAAGVKVTLIVHCCSHGQGSAACVGSRKVPWIGARNGNVYIVQDAVTVGDVTVCGRLVVPRLEAGK